MNRLQKELIEIKDTNREVLELLKLAIKDVDKDDFGKAAELLQKTLNKE